MDSSNDLSDELIRRFSVGGTLGEWEIRNSQLGRTCCGSDF